jgi:hypothetical protein
MSANFREWKTSKLLIHALHSGALAWIQQREPPSVASLNLPATTLGDLISRAYIEQTALDQQDGRISTTRALASAKVG